MLDALWERIAAEFPHADRPEVDVVRTIAPQEVGTVFAACFQEQGFAAEALPDGGVRPAPVPDAQSEALSIAQYVCTARYPIAEEYRQPLDEGQLRKLYAYYTGELLDCLSARGFAIDPTTAPSFTAFAESFTSMGGVPWSPYAFVVESGLTEAEWYEIQEACPQTPVGLFE